MKHPSISWMVQRSLESRVKRDFAATYASFLSRFCMSIVYQMRAFKSKSELWGHETISRVLVSQMTRWQRLLWHNQFSRMFQQIQWCNWRTSLCELDFDQNTSCCSCNLVQLIVCFYPSYRGHNSALHKENIDSQSPNPSSSQIGGCHKLNEVNHGWWWNHTRSFAQYWLCEVRRYLWSAPDIACPTISRKIKHYHQSS